MPPEPHEKKHLSIKSLLGYVRDKFDLIPQESRHSDCASLSDCLMSGLAMFSLKMPSLLHFNNHRSDEIIRHNLQTLYGVQFAPSDSYMRERLDPVEPRDLRAPFKTVFKELQRGKILEDYKYIEDRYLVVFDGSGTYSSNEIHCVNCCERQSSDGKITYHHQILSSALIHPDHKEVFPFCPEAIIKQDGETKNDCETNACTRLLADFKREHPHLKVIVTADSIHSNGPRIRQLKADDIGFIIGVKPGSHHSLFHWVSGLELAKYEEVKDGITYTFQWANNVPLNETHPDLLVNFLECWVDNPKTDKKHFTWITHLTIKKENVFKIAQGGRAKWKIENETFNTLKNQGYNFEHNYGHGHKNLSTVFTNLMMLAFLIDQVQQRTCRFFQAALKKMKTRVALWEKIRSLFTEYFVDEWADLYYVIETGKGRSKLPARPP